MDAHENGAPVLRQLAQHLCIYVDMYVCMYDMDICVYMYIYTHIYTYTNAHTHTHTHTHTHIFR